MWKKSCLSSEEFRNGRSGRIEGNFLVLIYSNGFSSALSEFGNDTRRNFATFETQFSHWSRQFAVFIMKTMTCR